MGWDLGYPKVYKWDRMMKKFENGMKINFGIWLDAIRFQKFWDEIGWNFFEFGIGWNAIFKILGWEWDLEWDEFWKSFMMGWDGNVLIFGWDGMAWDLKSSGMG